MRRGLSLAEVLISVSLMSFILISFFMIFSGINTESRIVETWSDIVSNTSSALDKIKASYLGAEYIFTRRQVSELLSRFNQLNIFNDTKFAEPIDNIDEFRNLTFPNDNVGNAICFLSFEGLAVFSGSNTRVIIPRYRINIIHLRSSDRTFLSWPNTGIIDLVLSQSQFIYSNETLPEQVNDPQLLQSLGGLIFLDKRRTDDISEFFRVLSGGSFQEYQGPINFPIRSSLLKNESYYGIRYSIAYNNNVMRDISSMNIRIPA
ncbi:MAG: hypothetical protein N2657_06615 [bacterium]|nr:hypothetical protein [bacterium]